MVVEMIMVNTHEAKTHLSKLINLVVEKHETVRICRNGKAMVDLVEPSNKPRKVNYLKEHPVLSDVKINYDPTEPLSSDEWPEDAR